MRLVLIIVLLLLLLGGLPGVTTHGFGYWPSGLLGLILLVVIVMALMGDRGGPAV